MADSQQNRRKRGRRKKKNKQDQSQSLGKGQGRGGSRGPKVRALTPYDDPSRTYMPDPPPIREYDPDPITGDPIENILAAIAHPSTGKPANIESVIRTLEGQEELTEGQRITYIGAGCFGVVEERREQGKLVVEIIKKIPYEDTHATYPWRREQSPGISRDYQPKPEPLDSLYTPEEEREFPKLGAASSAHYMPHSN
ncbi:hypothetical protein [Spirochaeta lutea]|uniref:Uncharacterized protein n=1 Tax=Spirochaeta lutea TaxID=1480694 RepID=A0A098QSD7_9SPIO|nr:hypothetical protein [Spirochaeta lutea]KGE70795.1 hypothetical protein DC28_14995 [Spirochaeta lutea]